MGVGGLVHPRLLASSDGVLAALEYGALPAIGAVVASGRPVRRASLWRRSRTRASAVLFLGLTAGSVTASSGGRRAAASVRWRGRERPPTGSDVTLSCALGRTVARVATSQQDEHGGHLCVLVSIVSDASVTILGRGPSALGLGSLRTDDRLGDEFAADVVPITSTFDVPPVDIGHSTRPSVHRCPTSLIPPTRVRPARPTSVGAPVLRRGPRTSARTVS